MKELKPKRPCFTILFIRNVRNRQILRDRKQIAGLPGIGGKGELGMSANGQRVSFWGDGNIVELDTGDVCTTL